MRALFLGIALPDAQTMGAVQGSNATLDELAKLPADGVDVVVFHPKKAAELASLPDIRARFPDSHLVLLTPTKWTEKAENIQWLLAQEGVDDLWFKETWEKMFPFFISKLANQGEASRWKQQCDELASEIEKLVKKLERDVELAAGIQRALLPKKTPDIPGIDITVRYCPATGSGGDYYDIFEFGDKKRFGLLVADSKTHGMAASLLAVLVKIRLEEMKERFPSSKSFVDFLNREIQEVHEKEMAHLGMLYGILDRASLTFQFTCAGHLKPILCRMGEITELDTMANPPLGSVDSHSFHENTIRLQPGDHVIFYTDGWDHLLKGNAREQIKAFLIKQATSNQEGHTVQSELMGIVDAHKEKEGIKDDLTFIHFTVQDKVMYLVPQTKKT